jgi:alpha-beta hydrolase superfamily lysophospholipase
MAEHLREAHEYLFNVNGIRDTIRSRVIEDLHKYPDGTRRILIGHSQGTFIAYDVMTAVAYCPAIDGFMTIGSLLGIDEIHDHLMWSRDNGFPAKLHGDWIHVFNPFDRSLPRQ